MNKYTSLYVTELNKQAGIPMGWLINALGSAKGFLSRNLSTGVKDFSKGVAHGGVTYLDLFGGTANGLARAIIGKLKGTGVKKESFTPFSNFLSKYIGESDLSGNGLLGFYTGLGLPPIGIASAIGYNNGKTVDNAINPKTKENKKVASILSDVGNYRPMNSSDVFTKGMPVGAIAGATLGAGHALMERDEYDPYTGKKKSKIKRMILEALAGAAGGATVAAASPMLMRAGLDLGGRGAMAVGQALGGGRPLKGHNFANAIYATGLKSRIAGSPMGTNLSLEKLRGIF